MDLVQEAYPVFASTLIFELWTDNNDEYYVKAFYNDVELDLSKYCYGEEGDPKCDLKTF